MCGLRDLAMAEQELNAVAESDIEGKQKTTVALLDIRQQNSLPLLEYAAGNDVAALRLAVEERNADIQSVDLWYGRLSGGASMVLVARTPVMVAALFGNMEVLQYLLGKYRACGADINRACGADRSTALHCAAAGGSARAAESITLLLRAGADKEALDSNNCKPRDVIVGSHKFPQVRASLERLLKSGADSAQSPVRKAALIIQTLTVEEDSPTNVPSSPFSSPPKSPASGSSMSSMSGEQSLSGGLLEYPADLGMADLKNGTYTSDEFRMYSFKVKPCARAYSHDWTECPFVHPGENARRRDPRRYHYSCVPCPDFKKGTCKRADTCEYAHGVFESWLHPAQYRTRLCKDGTACARRVCFFAHTSEELRPLYNNATITTPGSSSASSSSSRLLSFSTADMRSMSLSPDLPPASPSSVLMMSQFSPPGSMTPPMSPSAACMMASANAGLLPASSLEPRLPPGTSSRLRAPSSRACTSSITTMSSSACKDAEALHKLYEGQPPPQPSSGGEPMAQQLAVVGRSMVPGGGHEGPLSSVLASPRNIRGCGFAGLGLQIPPSPREHPDDFLLPLDYAAADYHMLPHHQHQYQHMSPLPSPMRAPMSTPTMQHQQHMGMGLPSVRRHNVTKEELLLQLDALQHRTAGMASPSSCSSTSCGVRGSGGGNFSSPIVMSSSLPPMSPSVQVQSALVAALHARRAGNAPLPPGPSLQRGPWRESEPILVLPSPRSQMLADWGCPTGKPQWGAVAAPPTDIHQSVRRSSSLPPPRAPPHHQAQPPQDVEPDLSWVQNYM
eukprot:jgi/Mesen1/5322/ME000265S04477